MKEQSFLQGTVPGQEDPFCRNESYSPGSKWYEPLKGNPKGGNLRVKGAAFRVVAAQEGILIARFSS